MGLEHDHTHSHAGRQQPSVTMGATLFGASLGERFLGAAALAALLWVIVYWALQ
jgi:hypothetical protein